MGIPHDVHRRHPWPGRGLTLLLVLGAAACARSGEGPSSGAPVLVDDAVPRVERVQRLLETLSADSMEGREAGTPGELRAVRFLEEELARYGVEPAGEEGYRQAVVLVRPPGGERWRLLPEDADVDTVPADRLRTAYNVLGRIPGTDPALADDIVVVGAHHDHVGFGQAVEGDSLYNGADDDASGSVAVLEMAREMARAARDGEGAPGRTVVAAFFTAEEMGLLGTRYWIEHPTVDFQRVVVDLQVEMIARPDSLAGGSGRGWLTGYERTTLGDLLAARGSPIVPDPRLEMRFFFRSDNLPFAQLGIPAHTLSSYNLHTDYHQPSDEAALADYPHMTALVEAAVSMLREITTGPVPEWKEGGRAGLEGGR
ncbi:MAG: M28 family peptidase [Gemmatimonadota bacterium]